MKILIIEDDVNKLKQLRHAAEATRRNASFREAASYRSGMKALIEWQPGVVLLDMTLPTYDVSSTDPGGRTRIFGGRDVLTEMKRRGLSARVILVTQFESFGEGPRRRTLSEITEELAAAFPNLFLGTVYYHPAQSDWRAEIERLLLEVTDAG